MRVCLVTSAYRPYLSGVGEHVHNLALALTRLGHDIHVLTANYPVPRTPYLAPRAPFPVSRLGRALVLPAYGGHFTLPVGLRLNSRVKQFFAGNRFDVVHCHGIFPPEICYYAALHSPAPVVVTFHSLVARLPGFIRSGFRALFPALRRKVKARIAVSEPERAWTQNWFPGECRVIPNGVDTTRFTPDARPARPRTDNEPTVLYVSRLDERKGILVLLRAMPRVLAEFPRCRLLVVGSGPLLEKCNRLCAESRLTAAVEFAGPVPPDDLPGWYASATAFAAPALGPESMGIILVEAMASGVPVVATDLAGYRTVVTHGSDGLLVPPGDAHALATSLLALLRNSDLRGRLRDSGRKRSLEFAWPEIARGVEEVYGEAVK